LLRLGTRRSELLNKLLYVLALAGVTTAAGAQPIPLANYRHTLEQGVDSGAYAQVAVGWLDHGERQFWFFGRDGKPDDASQFEIGAASEIFTGLLLARAAYEGKLRLQSTVRELLPKAFPLADPALGAITVQQLATHQSGLPALPPNLLPANIDDPYADYTLPNLHALLANYRLTQAPTAYSTLDAGLLGQLLGAAYDKDYASVLHDKILQPLGMQHTGFDDSLFLLSGHAHGTVAPHWHFSALGAAAGLRSSTGDLLTFLQQNLRPADSPLRAALLLARQAQDAATQDVGLGWDIVEIRDGEQSWPLVWRASRTAGFSTFLGFRTDRQQALVLLGNSDADLSALGIAWLEQRPPPPVPAPRAPAAAPKPASLDMYAGLYAVRGGAELSVRASERGLLAQVRGQPAVALQPIGEDLFAGETLVLTFQRDAGKVSSALVNADGVHVQAYRLSEHAPGIARAPIALDGTHLGDFVGDYRLDADTLLRIRAYADTLSLQITGRAPLVLRAFATDRFGDTDATCEVTFQRDDKHAVTGAMVDLGGGDRVAPRVVWAAPVLK
jgi:CubicO group peptidase (beta-lactamase class C family)